MGHSVEKRLETAKGRIWTSVYGRDRKRPAVLVLHGGDGGPAERVASSPDRAAPDVRSFLSSLERNPAEPGLQEAGARLIT
jgi:hypothetical protein